MLAQTPSGLGFGVNFLVSNPQIKARGRIPFQSMGRALRKDKGIHQAPSDNLNPNPQSLHS